MQNFKLKFANMPSSAQNRTIYVVSDMILSYTQLEEQEIRFVGFLIYLG